MYCPRSFRLLMVALLPAAAISLGVAGALAQSPPATPPATSAPAASPPATPAPAPSESTPSAPAPATPAPETPPAAAAPTPATPTPGAQVQTADPFGEETELTPKTVLILKGNATWDSAFETLMDSFRTLSTFLDKQGIKPAGPPLIVYTSTDDNGFVFQAEMPVDQEPKSLAKNMSMGKSPEGKAFKFVHRGSYDNMDNTYEAITNYLDDKKVEARDLFVEEYATDPLKTEEDKLVINVYVPLKNQ